MPKIVRFHQAGGPEVLQLENIDVSPPAAGEVQIEVHALGLNRAEAMFRSNQYLEQPHFPARIGYEASGTIKAIGQGVTGFQIGDHVSTVPAFSMNQYGVDGEVTNVPARAVVKHLPSLGWNEAAAIWMQYLTAYGALIHIAKMTAGDVVLIPAASSSVGIAAIQLANYVGATSVALTRTSAKKDSLLALGAKHVIATQEQNLVDEVNAITNGAGARIVFDPVGGATVSDLTAAMAQKGILFIYGALAPEATPLPLFSVLAKTLTIRGYLLFEFTDNQTLLQPAVDFINGGLESGALKPIIAKTFPLDQIVEAHRYLESNQQIGKIVVTVRD
ncbi:zinc-dependent alcohol dehydrogenase family protein [Planctomicrobium sp. SH527]|uniref:zinc-dependent alcohol dehydrogenase family protein n=1 Tax=Planctomicrobium sp. SH527 TaxID=3448123 RepID=UPI003F5B7C32